MANHICGYTSPGSQDEWESDPDYYTYLYHELEVALKQYTLEADAYGDIEFYFYVAHSYSWAEDGWPVVYSDLNGVPYKLLVDLTLQRVGLYSGERPHWAHCTLHLNTDLKKNQKVWIGIWSSLYSTTFDFINKSKPAQSDYYYVLDIEDTWEDPPPQIVAGFEKDTWRPVAVYPHYFVYSDVAPRTDYSVTLAASIGVTGVFGRALFKLLRKENENLHVAGDAIIHRRYRTEAHDFFSLSDGRILKAGFKRKRTETVFPSSSILKRRKLLKKTTADVGAEDSQGVLRTFCRQLTALLDAEDSTETWRDLVRKKAATVFITTEKTARKLIGFLIAETLRIRSAFTVSRVLTRLMTSLLSVWDRMKRHKITDRLEDELFSPVTTELILKSSIQEDDT